MSQTKKKAKLKATRGDCLLSQMVLPQPNLIIVQEKDAQQPTLHIDILEEYLVKDSKSPDLAEAL